MDEYKLVKNQPLLIDPLIITMIYQPELVSKFHEIWKLGLRNLCSDSLAEAKLRYTI
jgi:hypothetical protein